MKQSVLSSIKLQQTSMQAYANEIVNMMQQINKQIEHPVAQPVVDTTTQNIVGYEALVDASEAEQKSKKYEFFGHEIEVPILEGKFITTTNEKVNTQIFAFQHSELEKIMKSVISGLQLTLDSIRYLDASLFGLTPEFQNLPPMTDTGVPMYGKDYLDLISGYVGNIPANVEIEFFKQSQLENIRKGHLILMLEAMLAKYKLGLQILQKKGLKLDTTSVVSSDPVVAHLETTPVNTVNMAVVTPVVNNLPQGIKWGK